MSEAAHHAKALASYRRLDPDLAACAAAIQNIGRITQGKIEGHAEAGYEPARKLLSSLGCFSPREVELLAASVRNHSNKGSVDSPMDELVKDVDVYVRYIQGHQFTGPHELKRLSTIRLELQAKKGR
jgi:HD superfamily phosphodiesterase